MTPQVPLEETVPSKLDKDDVQCGQRLTSAPLEQGAGAPGLGEEASVGQVGPACSPRQKERASLVSPWVEIVLQFGWTPWRESPTCRAWRTA